MVLLSRARPLLGGLLAAVATTASAQGPPSGFSIPAQFTSGNPFFTRTSPNNGAGSTPTGSASGSSSTGSTSGGSSPVSSVCVDSNNLCAGINIPSSGSDGDTYFQIKASTSGGYAGLGVGNQMAGSLIFVVYANSAGDNITLSPRLGKGEIEPLYDSSIQATLLPGSGIVNNQFVANIKCSNCRTWSGGSLDTSSSDQSMIWSIGPGSKINSDQPDASISQHTSNGFLALDVKKATGGSTDNPFANTADSSSVGGGSSGGKEIAGDFENKWLNYVTAHAVIMSITWVLLFPLGAAVIRLMSHFIPNAVLVHQLLQLFNFCLAIIGLGLGVYASQLRRDHFKHFHQVFGVVLVALLLVQAMLGSLHHARYQKVHRRTFVTYCHLWLGRIVILLAIINGGIGLQPELANASTGQIAAYAVVSAIVIVTYMGFYFIGLAKRH